jgi:hypothetical protein
MSSGFIICFDFDMCISFEAARKSLKRACHRDRVLRMDLAWSLHTGQIYE